MFNYLNSHLLEGCAGMIKNGHPSMMEGCPSICFKV
jgi:hypothetical protein